MLANPSDFPSTPVQIQEPGLFGSHRPVETFPAASGSYPDRTGLLRPIKADGLVFEPPGLHQFKSPRPQWICRPQNQRTVIGRDVSNRQSGLRGKIKTVVVRHRVASGALGAPIAERPRRVGVNHAVLTPALRGGR